MTNEIILQNLRDFTVQIRDPETDAIIGTGIAATLDGKIVTCAHVVETALGQSPCDAGEAEISVYFPQARGEETKSRRAAAARQETACAQTMSQAMGYHWGQVDAAEVLARK